MPAAYTRLIRRIAPDANAVGVECSMRLMYGTLDHLDEETFVREAALARECEAADPGYMRRTADSYGLARDYDREEERRAS
ncbi:MAG: hypothetical protein OXG35_06765 [Acidobacteria bacterium]|nr:hypothetical protein [Acidobacteriota bacterium]